ncbi:MAG: RNA-binding transcriptional accessory protein [Bacteroidales bacterium]|nr:RNA-binding transcriptional accessory protein [Bacteroidales bacterium]
MYKKLIADIVGVTLRQVENTIKLIDDGATVPFISRYRKEATGNLDEVKIGEIKEQYTKYQELAARKQTILKTIEEQGQLTPQLREKIEQSWDATEIEDIYLPYKPKRKTRATKARENGLEPLAQIIRQQRCRNIEAEAQRFVTEAVPTADDALQGARDIVAEQISEDTPARDIVRRSFDSWAQISAKLVKGKEEEGAKYKDYFQRDEQLRRCPSHRLLAMMRAEREGIVKLKIAPDKPENVIERLCRRYVRERNAAAEQMSLAIDDAYKRLLEPQIETEFYNKAKENADTEAIKVFAKNLQQLLLSAPLGQKRILALDPGFRTGCKTVCLDEHGTLLYHTAIFPHPPVADRQGAARIFGELVAKYRIEAVAIGNGTASRETEQFVNELNTDKKLAVFVVSEDGASIYSASATAREEFPNEDVTVRGAVSIGRRLMDPLAELVKIDPKSIGVGQYQHDVDQTRLKNALETTVESCVNTVGVNLNTASKHLLTYVSGLGPMLAQNIVDYRSEHGAFTSREELKKVPRLGPKAFEQCAGFLRIPGAKNPLDNSAVHPESYKIVSQMATDMHCTVAQLIADKKLRSAIDLQRYVGGSVGLPTLTDIMAELEKPGRDPREQITQFAFAQDVKTIDDVRVGMELPGIVTNITAFGAFVDIGVKHDGLVHISQMSAKYVADAGDIVKLHQQVVVKVTGVDLIRNRISLSMIR